MFKLSDFYRKGLDNDQYQRPIRLICSGLLNGFPRRLSEGHLMVSMKL